MKKKPYDFDGAIKSANDQVAIETNVHQKRMEFWAGYKAALEEVQRHFADQESTWKGHSYGCAVLDSAGAADCTCGATGRANE